MAEHNEIGKKGENLAVEYLQNKGYKILHRNWIHQKNEIDIIASLSDTVVFVEVKTRTSDYWGNPEDAISENKIKRIVDAAEHYLNECTDLECARFDVISILLKNGRIEIEHIEDAFLAPLN